MSKKLRCFSVLISFYFFLLLAGSFCWMLNVTQLSAVLPLAAMASCIGVALYDKVYYKKVFLRTLLKSAIFLLIVICVAVIFSNLIFDSSYDGQTYHYETQYALLNGWNPVKQLLAKGTYNIFFINHYAKGYESGAAFFWAFFKNPESGKALNIVLLGACFLYVAYFLQHLGFVKNKVANYLFAMLISFNPVAIYQLFTFYVDGQIASLITILIAALYLYMKERSGLNLFIAVICFCLLSSIKFTGLIYGVMIFGFFGVWMLVKKMNILRFVLAGMAACVVAIFLIAYNPYVTNTVRQSNPFYPLVGKNKIDIITPVQPLSFAHKNFVEKFISANFSRSHNIHGHTITPEPVFKIPFTFSVNEWLVFKGSECRVAGYGPLFGGVLLLSFFLFFIAIIKNKRAIIRNDSFIICVLLFLSVVINPEMWMARYVPQLWLFPFCVAWLCSSSLRQSWVQKITGFSIFIILINVCGIAAVNWSVSGLLSYKMHKEIAWIKKMNRPVQLQMNDFIAARERLKYYNIAVEEVEKIVAQENDQYKLQNSHAIILLPEGVSKFENKGILKLLDKKLE